jgi:hypothetical protein
MPGPEIDGARGLVRLGERERQMQGIKLTTGAYTKKLEDAGRHLGRWGASRWGATQGQAKHPTGVFNSNAGRW